MFVFIARELVFHAERNCSAQKTQSYLFYFLLTIDYIHTLRQVVPHGYITNINAGQCVDACGLGSLYLLNVSSNIGAADNLEAAVTFTS